MDTINEGKKRQNRTKGKCWGCDREDVELVSSVFAEGIHRRICDACRKDISNHPEIDPVAVLTSRRELGGQSVSRDKLITLNTQLTRLINTLRKIGADERVRDAVRTLVEPYLTPIADDIWPKVPHVPAAAQESAPAAPSAIKDNKRPNDDTHTPQQKSHGKLPIPVRKPPKADAKAAAKVPVIDKSKGSLYRKASKYFDRINWKRRKDGLQPLQKPADPAELIRQYQEMLSKKGQAAVH